jgi:YfiH family protein
MIRTRGFPGIAFGEANDGDPRRDLAARTAVSDALGISDEWVLVDQVHGSRVVVATGPGHLGPADGIVTRVPELPVVIATADCVPVVMIGKDSVGVIHAGWRGVAAGIVPEASRIMRHAGDEVLKALIGPHIGPCCYEVGDEVVASIGGYEESTTSGSRSVNLAAAIRHQLSGVDVRDASACTMHDNRFNSFRDNATPRRQVTVAWIPQD